MLSTRLLADFEAGIESHRQWKRELRRQQAIVAIEALERMDAVPVDARYIVHDDYGNGVVFRYEGYIDTPADMQSMQAVRNIFVDWRWFACPCTETFTPYRHPAYPTRDNRDYWAERRAKHKAEFQARLSEERKAGVQ